jgi:hypothetical protein
MAAYGEPKSIVPRTQADPEFQTYGVDFIYANNGFLVAIGGQKPLTLEPTLLFRDFIIYGSNREYIGFRDEWIQPWQGFKEYDYSCIKVAYLINSCGKMPVKLP